MIPLITRLRHWVVLTALILAGSSLTQAQYAINLYTTAAGDAGYSWNSRYGGDAYSGVGAVSLDSYTSFYSGIPSDTQYTVSIFMVPISQLVGGTLSGATLYVNSLGFNTWYYYGSVNIGWLDTGSMTLTGNVVADGLGAPAKARPGGWTIYNSDVPGSGDAGLRSYDVASFVQQDLTAGRAFSTFVLSSSRDSSGSISAAESGSGPMIVALSSIPEPSTYAALAGVLVLGLAIWRRRQWH